MRAALSLLFAVCAAVLALLLPVAGQDSRGSFLASALVSAALAVVFHRRS